MHIKKDFFDDFIQFSRYIFLMPLSLAFALPGLIVNMPVSIILGYLAEKERIKCLKASTVKVLGKDVITSYKLVIGAIVMPIYWFI